MTTQNAFHEIFDRKEKIEGSSNRGFGLVFAAFFGLLGGLALWNGGPHWYWWVGLACTTLIITLTVPRALTPLNWAWTRLGLVLAKVISPIALGIIFFGVMTPIGAILRLRKKDVLHLKFDLRADSYWILRQPPGPDPDSMKNQF
jgi:hypothetical protein